MKVKYKIITTFFIAFIILITIVTTVFATTLSDLDEPASNTFKKSGKTIVSILTSIGIVISVLALAFLGIKYMLGSVEERADYKKSLMPYFIGAMLTFGASTIANIIYKFIK